MEKDREELYGLRHPGHRSSDALRQSLSPKGELNEIEQWKLERHPLEIADAIIDTYSVRGACGHRQGARARSSGSSGRASTRSSQGGDAFMLRVKIPGGHLTAPQIREIGVVADAFGEGPDGTESRVFGSRYADLTTRQTVQIHWLRIEDIPRIWRRFAAVGLTTVQACGDSARNVLCCPVSGVDADEAFDALPVARAISDFFTGNREYANLPRKFKISVTGCVEDCAKAEINDIGLWPARAADGTLGFNRGRWAGGCPTASGWPRTSTCSCSRDQAVEITRAIAQLFGELGNRENRGLARMRYLVQELGPEGFRAELGHPGPLRPGPAGEDLTRRYRGDHVGVHPQKEAGLFYVGCSRAGGADERARAGRGGAGWPRPTATARCASPPTRTSSSPACPRTGSTTCWPRTSSRSTRPIRARSPGGWWPAPGAEFCRYAIVETKERAVKWARFLDEQLADEPVGSPAQPEGPRPGPREDAGVVRMHFSGCSASCAQPQIADIGFRGEVAHVGNHLAEAVDIGMGGSLGFGSGFIDWIEHARPGQRRARRPVAGAPPLPGGAAPGRALLQLGPAGSQRRPAPDAGRGGDRHAGRR